MYQGIKSLMDQPLILLVDDNDSIARLVDYKLKKDSYRPEVRTNGIDGLSAIRELKPDLVILDVMTPGMSGYEILQEMRNDAEISDIKVLLLTSKNRDEDIARAFNLGVMEYMSKPFRIGELSMRIRKMLD